MSAKWLSFRLRLNVLKIILLIDILITYCEIVHKTTLMVSQHWLRYNDLEPLGNKPLPEPILTQVHVAI